MQSQRQTQSAWARELDDLIRAACGGFLFGIPLLYTMEVWWVGAFTTPPRMLGAIGCTLIIVTLLNHVAGFRKNKETRITDSMRDSVEVMAISILCTAGVLFTLRRITLDTPLDEGLGHVIYEAIPFALGATFARQLLSGTRQEDPAEPSAEAPAQQSGGAVNATLVDIGATLIGAIFVAFNIVPTDEIPMLTATLSGPWLVGLIVASLLISYGIVFEANFADQQSRLQQQGIFQHPLSETVAAYLVSLLAAALMLWFFQQFSVNDPWQLWLSYTIVLGFPAAMGGAAGRLAI